MKYEIGSCLDCGKPTVFAYCDGCAPPSRSVLDSSHTEGSTASSQRMGREGAPLERFVVPDHLNEFMHRAK